MSPVLISEKLLNSVHDVSAGGILISIVEMSIPGKIGAKIKIPENGISTHEYLFGEDQSRYIIEVKRSKKDTVTKILEKNSIFFDIIGKTQKDCLELDKEFNIKLYDLCKLNSFWFKDYFK